MDTSTESLDAGGAPKHLKSHRAKTVLNHRSVPSCGLATVAGTFLAQSNVGRRARAAASRVARHRPERNHAQLCAVAFAVD